MKEGVHTKSKIIIGLLAFLLVSTTVASLVDLSIGTASADTSGDFQYTLINSGTAVEITGYTGTGVGNITIPNSIAGEPVTMIGDNVFLSKYHITGVTIPSTVTSIGYWAFNSCIRLSEVNIPNGVTTIGPGAFRYCWALKSVTIPSSVTTMGDYAFANGVLSSVTIPSSVTTMGSYAFAGGVMTSATINSHNVSDYAFSACSKLTTATFGSGFDKIGNFSFYGCSALTSITIPSTVTSIGSQAFGACTSLAITVSPSNPDFASANGALYNQNMTTLIACPGAMGVFTIPNGVKMIGDYAFENSLVSSVTIPNSVTTIGNSAFQFCERMTSVTIGSGVTTIGYTVFEYCGALTNMALYGLIAPTSVQADSWIYSTHGLFGHAYYASNFPAPGHIWAGLTMGSYLSNTSVASGAPTGLVAMGGPGFIFLNWTAPVNVGTPPLTQFALFRGTSSGGYGSPLITFDSNTATYNDTTATPGTQYYYVLKAVNTVGSSLPSNEATGEATTSAQSVPGAPTDLVADGHSGYIILTWVAPVNLGNPAFTAYHIWRGATADSMTILVYVNTGTLSYNDTSVANGQAYVYKVKANNSFGESPFSNEATATAGTGTLTTPSAPQSFTATPGPGKVTLTWSAPASNGGAVITGYKIYRSTGGGEATQIGTTGSGILTYEDTTGTVNTTYSYYVVAVNSVGSGAASSSQSAAPQSGGATPTGSDNGALLAGIGILVVVIIIVGLFLYMRSRKKKS